MTSAQSISFSLFSIFSLSSVIFMILLFLLIRECLKDPPACSFLISLELDSWDSEICLYRLVNSFFESMVSVMASRSIISHFMNLLKIWNGFSIMFGNSFSSFFRWILSLFSNKIYWDSSQVCSVYEIFGCWNGRSPDFWINPLLAWLSDNKWSESTFFSYSKKKLFRPESEAQSDLKLFSIFTTYSLKVYMN